MISVKSCVPLGIFILLGSVYSAESFAVEGCESDLTQPIIIQSGGNGLIPRDAPVGKVLESGSVNFGVTITELRTGFQFVAKADEFTPLVIGLTLDGRPIRRTTDPGIGIAYWTDADPYPRPDAQLTLITATDSKGLVTGRLSYAFIKTGNIGSQILDGQAFTPFYVCSGPQNNISQSYKSKVNITGQGRFSNSACSVGAASTVVSMGKVNRSKFNGLGSTAGDTEFFIQLTCDSRVEVNVTLNPGVSGALDATGVLNLDASDNGAQGVGLQLLYGNSPIKFNEPILTGNSQKGNYNVRLAARYYQTSATITPGVANATATFTMTFK